MKLSAQERYAGYSPAAVHARVCLNGVVLTHVIYADEEGGELVQYDLDQAGRIRTDADGSPKTVRRRASSASSSRTRRRSNAICAPA